MRYRIAKPADLKSIVNLHYKVRESYNLGFFSHMKRMFFFQYYKILLNDKNEIILCAEDETGKICGFISATLDANEQFNNLKRNRFKLAFASLTTLITTPKVLKEIIKRYKSMADNGSSDLYISKEGCRGEFWAWDTHKPDPAGAVELQSRLIRMLRALGVKKMYSEVDVVNKRIVKFHQLNGAYEVGRITLPDGRERLFLCNDLNQSGYSF